MKIYSETSLRNINQLALTANVACTSGGGIGQIVNAVKVDVENQKKVLIFGGANEIKHIDNIPQYVYTIEKATEKLHGLALSKEVTVIMPTVPLETVEEVAKYEHMKEKLISLPSIKVRVVESRIPYEGKHPTEKGSGDIIESIAYDLSDQLILQKDEVTTDRRYSFVQSCYKVGCRGCDLYVVSQGTMLCFFCLYYICICDMLVLTLF